MRFSLIVAAAIVVSAPAFAQDAATPEAGMAPDAAMGTSDADMALTDGDMAMPDAELVGNMGKIESNIAEAAAKLYLLALMPAGGDGREEALSEYRDDLASVDDYLPSIGEMDLPQEVMSEIEGFSGSWEEAKAPSADLEDAGRDNLPGAEALAAHDEAFESLDDYIDAALVLAGVDDSDSE